MNEPEFAPDPLKDLIDDYLHDLLDEPRLKGLEALLSADAEARRYFVRYARLHTDLHLEARALKAGQRALGQIEDVARANKPTPALHFFPRFLAPVSLAAACLALAIGAALWFGWHRPGSSGEVQVVARLINAQNCQWADDVDAAGNMQAGRTLTIERGLAEIQFHGGARVLLEGPAKLALLTGNSARLVHGKLAARVPEGATGFTVLSPQGKVIDLGTEFGLAVADDGATDVFVFQGKVEAYSDSGDKNKPAPVSLTQNQAARIAEGKVVVQQPEGADRIVRAIVPPPVLQPRTFRLDFHKPASDGVFDALGHKTGLTQRLPGTGSKLPELDPNLRIDLVKAQLELTTTRSDLNTQFNVARGEYLGVSLSKLGFTGKEDFTVSVVLPNIPALANVGQFGLYAGARSDKNIRGGLLGKKEKGTYTQFLVNNPDGRDIDLSVVGLLSTGTDLRLTLKRTAGKYAMTVDNLTDGSSSTLMIRLPQFLDNERELYVGLFGANPQSNVRGTLVVKEFEATVWAVTQTALP